MHQQREKFTSFYGIKGLGALAIMVFHFTSINFFMEGHSYPFNDQLKYIYAYGFLAVEVFFILSGYLMEYNYSRCSTDKIHTYIHKRYVRMWPLIYFTIPLTLLLEIVYNELFEDFYSFSLWGVMLHIFGMEGIGLQPYSLNAALWQIGVQFFLCVLFFYTLRLKDRKYIVYIVFIVLGMVLYVYYSVPFLQHNVGRGLMSFFMGVLLCRYRRAFSVLKWRCLVWIIISTFLMACYGSQIIGTLGCFFALSYFPAWLICILEFKVLDRIFSFRPFVALGKISYGIYGFHVPLQTFSVIIYRSGLFPNFKLYSPAFLLGWICASIILGYISHIAIEPKIEQRLDKTLSAIKDA